MSIKEKQVSECNNLLKCPKCGSSNISSDVDIDHSKDYPRIIREYDFCFDCGYEWNIKEIKNEKGK